MNKIEAARIIKRLSLGHDLKWLMGREHVATNPAEIERNLRDRVAKAFAKKGKKAPGPKAQALGAATLADAVVTYALMVHAHNRRIYRRVMK